ncbi:MAG: hypothetical protein ABI885_30120, partial [Gammaproteobacteria bacterium]
VPPLRTPPTATPPSVAPLPVDPEEPPPSLAPSVQTIDAAILRQALSRGVPLTAELPVPGPTSPAGMMWWGFEHKRRAYSNAGNEVTVVADGSGMAVAQPTPNRERYLFPVQLRHAQVAFELSGESVNVRQSNGVGFTAQYVPLAGQIELDKVSGDWRNAQWFVQLLPQSVAKRPDLVRVCWHVNLPDLEQSAPAFEGDNVVSDTIPAGPTIRRLQCSVHRRSDGQDVGAKVIDDVSGAVTTYSAEW